MAFQGEVLPIGALLERALIAPAYEPAPTGSAQLDAAFAALADHLAERDG